MRSDKLLTVALVLALAGQVHAVPDTVETPDLTVDLRVGRSSPGRDDADSNLARVDLRGIEGPSGLLNYGESGTAVVNLRGVSGGLAVWGRVIDGDTGSALVGAAVQIGAHADVTDGDGRYRIDDLSCGEHAVTVSLGGYVDFSGTLSVPPGASLNRDFLLYENGAPGSGPRVVGLDHKYDGTCVFLNGISFNVRFTALVDWAGEMPGKVVFQTPLRDIEVPTSGNTASTMINVGTDLGVAGWVKAKAVTGGGLASSARKATLSVAPDPFPPGSGALFSAVDQGNDYAYRTSVGVNLAFIDEGVTAGVIPEDIPLFGSKGCGLQFIPSVDCEVTSDGRAEIFLKWKNLEKGKLRQMEAGRQDNLKKMIALIEDYAARGKVDKRRLPRTSATGAEIALYPILEGGLQFDFVQGTWRPAEFGIGIAGHAKVSRSWPFIFLAGPVPIPMYAKASAELEADAMGHVLGLNPLDLNFTASVEPYVRGSLGAGVDQVFAVEGWVGGGATLDLQYPHEPHMEGLTLYINAGVSVYALLFQWEREGLRWDWDIHGKAGKALYIKSLQDGGIVQPQLVQREYLRLDDYGVFLAAGKRTARALAPQPLRSRLSALQLNVFPHSEAKCVEGAGTVFLGWLYDDPARAAINRTVLVASRYDGADWTDPAVLEDDGTPDFHPAMVAFPSGDAVVVWEDAAAPLVDTATFEDMKAALQISVALYDAAGSTWLATRALTTNACLDRSPLVSGISSDNILVTWITNPDNHPVGTASNANEIWSSRWNGTNWSAAALAAIVTNPISKCSLLYDGTDACLVMSVDEDNDMATIADRELHSLSCMGGTWGGLQRLTDNAVADENPALALDGAGRPVMVWVSSNEVSSAIDFDIENRQVIWTADSYSSSLADFELIRNEGGQLATVWAEASDYSSDVWAMFYDPILQLWGNPKQLTFDTETETGLTAAFSGTDSLIAVYDRQTMQEVKAVRDLPGGGQAIMSIPKPGSTDLYVLQYQLGEDLALAEGSFVIDPPNPQPGLVAQLRVTAENRGDKPMENVPVAFYNGNPGVGGVEIGRTNLVHALPPGSAVDAELVWTVPSVASVQDIFAVIDPDLATADANRSNNWAIASAVQSDLAVASVSWLPMPNGAVAISATIRNEGVITSETVVVEFRLDGADGVLLASAILPVLAPGESTDAAFEWDMSGVNGQAAIYVGFAGGGPSDYDPANNEVILAVDAVSPDSEPVLGALVVTEDGAFRFDVYGESGYHYVVQSSSNLIHWTDMTNFVSSAVSTAIADQNAADKAKQYYRAVRR